MDPTTPRPDGPKLWLPMHRLLRRQVARQGPAERFPAQWEEFLDAVNAAYHQSDADRNMLERSLELSSKELLQANSEMMALFEAVPDLFFRIAHDGTILDYKGAARADFYRTSGSLHGKRIQDIPERNVANKFRQAIQAVIDTGKLVTIEYELALQHTNRSPRKNYFEARLLPLRRSPHGEGQLIVIIRNITDQKETRQELVETTRSNVELEQFAYIASHDLQEPLRTVQSFLQLLRRRYADKLDTDANEFIDYAIDGARRMRDLITDLLAYSRVTSRAQPPKETNLDAVVSDVVASLDTAIAEAGAEIQRGTFPTVRCDRRQISQLFLNLLSNALKFRRKERPEIVLSARQADSEWCFSIKDNGIGIAPQYAEKVFMAFKRLHTRDECSGTGIGLAICKKIVENHGGRIWVESEPEQGSTFLFTLPIDHEDQ